MSTPENIAILNVELVRGPHDGCPDHYVPRGTPTMATYEGGDRFAVYMREPGSQTRYVFVGYGKVVS